MAIGEKLYFQTAVMLAAIVASYFAFASGSHWLDLYGALGDAFLSGSTAIAGPAFDASYFEGKYYLYFGPTPALAIYIPIKLLTGISITEDTIVPIENAIGTTCLTLLVYQLASRASRVHRLGWIYVVLSIGFGSWMLFNNRAAHIYSAAIAGAYCFTALGALLLWQFLKTPSRSYWAVLASLCFGLGVGSRITHVGNVIFLLLACWHVVRLTPNWRTRITYTIRLLAPWALCIAALAFYNYQRFGHPFETGAAYMNLGQSPEQYSQIMSEVHSRANGALLPCMSCEKGFFKSSVILPNLYYYLASPLFYNPEHVSWHYLFFQQKTYVPSPLAELFRALNQDAGAPEYSYGLLLYFPFVAWYFMSLGYRKPYQLLDARACVMVRGLWLFAFITFVILLTYHIHAIRYQQDFGPWMMAAAGFYYLRLLDRTPSPRAVKWLLIIGGVMVVYGTLIGAVYGICADNRC